MKEYFKYRGLVEGFYGRPWSREERLDSFTFLGKHGYNIYYYAPKSDPYHRELWRKPYPAKKGAEFAELARAARRNGLIFSFAVSPGLSIRYTSEEDFALLLEKMLTVSKLGANAFSLFLDDISPRLEHPADKARFKDLAAAHAYLTNRLFRELARRRLGAHFTMCPTYYCGDPNNSYVRRLGSLLDKGIEVFWTGPEVCSARLTEEHTAAVSKSLKRKVLYWDNYPVNDSVMVFEPHLGPFDGRAPGLYRHCSGVIANPSLQAEMAKIPLATIGDYLRDPLRYQPAAAWDKALKQVAGAASYKAFRRFADHCWKSCLYREEGRLFREELKRRAYFHGFVFDSEIGARVISFLEELKREARTLAAGKGNSKLLAECRPWLAKYRLVLGVFGDCVRFLCARRDRREQQAAALERKIDAALLKMHKDFYSVSDYCLAQEIQRVRIYAELIKRRQEG